MKTTSRNLFRTYRQSLSATFATPEDAAAATLAFRELPPGMEVSLSSRWDDSNPRHLQNAQAVTAADAKATYYLNASDPDFIASTVKPVLALGCSVGIHTKTHPFPTQLSLGALFDEILANRVAVESAADTPVNAFTLPFYVYKCLARPGFEHFIGESLRRTGIFGGGEFAEDPASMYAIPADEYVGSLHYGFDDVHPSQALFLKGVETAEERFRTGDLPACGTHIAMGTHAWADDAGMAEITRCFKLRTKNPAAPYAGRTWFCNENEFAASWIQARHTRVAAKSVDGATAIWTLERVEPAELGDNVPLFLQFGRGPLSASIAVDANGQASLPHAEDHAVPTRIDAVDASGDGASAKFPGVSAHLVVDRAANTARLTVANHSAAPLKDLAVTLRLPLFWNSGFARTEPVDLPVGDVRDFVFDLGAPSANPEAAEGPLFSAAQIDFRTSGLGGRLYATTKEVLPSRPRPDAMRDAMRITAPQPAVLWTQERLSKLSLPDSNLSGLALYASTRDPIYAGNSYNFRSDDPAWQAAADAVPADLRGQRLQIAIVDFDAQGGDILLDCRAPTDFFLNGVSYPLVDGATVPTRPGRNRIILAQLLDHWCPRGNFALVDAKTHRPLPLHAPL